MQAYEAFRRIRSVRSTGRPVAIRAPRRNTPARSGVQEKGRAQPKEARPKTEAEIRRPRPCRSASVLEGFRAGFFRLLPDQLGVGQPLAHDLLYQLIESIRILPNFSVRILAVVVAKSLFIQITEQVVRFDAHVGTIQAALQETPEVLHTVRVDVAANVLFSMIDDLMNELLFKSPVRNQFVGEDVRAGCDIGLDVRLKSILLTIRNNGSLDLPAALKHSHHNGLAVRPAPP